MTKTEPNPDSFLQNLHGQIAVASGDHGARIDLYRQIVDRARAQLASGRLTLRAPRLRGLRQTGGPPFHATPELFFQQNGSTRFDMPFESFAVAAGEVCIMPRGMPHAETTIERKTPFLTLITMFWPDGFSLHFGHASPGHRVYSAPHDRFHLHGGFLPQCLEEIVAALHASEGRVDDYARSLLAACLAGMRTSLDRIYVKTSGSQHLVERCQSLIEQHLTNRDLSVTQLAAWLGCTPDHLSRAYRRRTGLTLIQSIHRARIAHATSLMFRDEFNISEIAWASGYATQSYFNRLFFREMAMTPRQYRASIARLKPGISPQHAGGAA